jgi:hypothetical protein
MGVSAVAYRIEHDDDPAAAGLSASLISVSAPTRSKPVGTDRVVARNLRLVAFDSDVAACAACLQLQASASHVMALRHPEAPCR